MDSSFIDTEQKQLAALKWALTKLFEHSHRHIDRFQIHRAIDEASTIWQNDAKHDWWKCMQEASQSLGLHAKVMSSSPLEIWKLVESGLRVVVPHPDTKEAMVLFQHSNTKILAMLHEDPKSKHFTLHQFINLWKTSEIDADQECVAYEPEILSAYPDDSAVHTNSPWSRLIGFWQPESHDIYLIVLFSLIAGILSLATPLAVESLVNTLIYGNLLQPVVILSAILFGFLSFTAVLNFLQIYMVEIMQRRMYARLSADFATRLTRTKWEAIPGTNGQELLNRFFDVMTLQKVTAQLLLDGISIIMTTIIGMGVLAFYHPWLIGFDAVLLGLIAILIFVLGNGAISSSIKESKLKYKMAAWLEDLAACPTTFRQDGANEMAVNKTDELIYQYLSARKKHFRILSRQIVAALCIQVVASTVLLGLGGWLVIQGQLLLGQLVAAELIVTIIVSSFAKLGKHMESFYDLTAAVDKLGQVIDLPLENTNGILRLDSDKPATIILKNLVTEHLNLSKDAATSELVFGSGEHQLLAPGEASSELIDICYGLKEPKHGELTINSVSPRDMRADHLRRYVALVRSIEVFHSSVEENIHLQRKDVTHQMVVNSIEELNFDDFLQKYTAGILTDLQSDGKPFNTFELVRLMIARAIVAKPRLLLIDGLLDILPEAEFRFLVQQLTQPEQPWTLLLVSSRTDWVNEQLNVMS